MALKLQQTKVESSINVRFKEYAERVDKTVQEVYSDAIRAFIESYPQKNIPFLASPVSGVTLSFRLDEDLILKAKAVCKNKASDRRLYYTAIITYAKEKGLI